MILFFKKIVWSLKYSSRIVKHKWFVFLAGRKLKVFFWRLLKHDLSKFSLSELPDYGRSFCGDGGDPERFNRAWLHHQNHNDHHWEYWVMRQSHNSEEFANGIQAIEIPDQALREMLADWIGASRSYEGKYPNFSNWVWLEKHLPEMRIHIKSKEKLMNIISELTKKTKKCKRCGPY